MRPLLRRGDEANVPIISITLMMLRHVDEGRGEIAQSMRVILL
jgi:hypothetical protein